MHSFYRRIETVFKYSHSNRSKFCRKYGHNYQTLQTYWKTEKLPPGNVLADLAKEYHVSLDTLVFGVAPQPTQVEHPLIRSIVRFLETLSQSDLLRMEGAMRMFGYLREEFDGTIVPAEDESVPKQEWASLEPVDEE